MRGWMWRHVARTDCKQDYHRIINAGASIRSVSPKLGRATFTISHSSGYHWQCERLDCCKKNNRYSAQMAGSTCYIIHIRDITGNYQRPCHTVEIWIEICIELLILTVLPSAPKLSRPTTTSNSMPICKNLTPSLRSFGEIFYDMLSVHTVNDILVDTTHNNRIVSGSGNGRFPDNHFLGQTFPGQDVSRTTACPNSSIISRTRRFPDNHFPGQTFPGQFV